MSSSDSEDDCYTNAAKRLKIMQKKFKDDAQVVNTSEVADEEEEIYEIPTPEKKENLSPIKTSFKIKSLDDFVVQKDKGVLTRAGARKRSIVIGNCHTISGNVKSPSKNVQSPTKISKSTKKSAKSPVKVPSPPKTVAPPKSARGRGRRNSRRFPWGQIFPQLGRPMGGDIISIGNTAEYTDNSENQVLFTSAPSNDVMIIDEARSSSYLDDSILEENEEMSVKVFWQNCNIFKFNIRKYQKITQIFEYFSSKESVEFDKLFFMYDEVILKPDDTPESINYNIGKFIEGGIVNNCIKNIEKVKTAGQAAKNKLILKFQFSSQKKIKPFEVEVTLNELIMKSMLKCAEYLETTCGNLKFLFDGELIPVNKTLSELDIEGGETIDVVIINENFK